MDDLSPTVKILHRATKGVKFHRTIIVRSKLAHKIRFLMRLGETRTLLRRRESDRVVEPVEVTGMEFPLPTIIEEGKG